MSTRSRNPLAYATRTSMNWADQNRETDPRAAELWQRHRERGGLDFLGDFIDKNVHGAYEVGKVAAPIAATYFGGPAGAAMFGGVRGYQEGGPQGAAIGAGLGYLGGRMGHGPGSAWDTARATATGAEGTLAALGPNEVAGGAGGFLGAAGMGAGAAAAGGMSWEEMVLHGIPVITNYLDAREKAKQAKRLQDAQRKQRLETLGFASPEEYLANYQKYFDSFKESYKPWLVGEQDRAAVGESGAMQAFDTDVARRGLSGSGLALAGRSAIRTGRQAQIGENMRKYWTMTDEAARGAASDTRSAEINASLGAPYTYVPRPSPTNAAVQGLGDAYRDWLWLQGTQNNPFVSKKDQPYR